VALSGTDMALCVTGASPYLLRESEKIFIIPGFYLPVNDIRG
jgi:hypothetical protein